MDAKKEILHYIKTVAAQQVTQEELLTAYTEGKLASKSRDLEKTVYLQKILYYLGGMVILSGIVILLIQHWHTLSYITKLLATLGIGIAGYAAGVLLSKNISTHYLGQAFYLISIAAIPAGLSVLLDHAGFDIFNYSIQTSISAAVFCLYLLSYFIFRSTLFVLASILLGTWFFFSLTNLLLISHLSITDEYFFTYRLLATGCVYILLGYAFSHQKHQTLTGFLYGAGIVGFLGALLMLSSGNGSNNLLWEILFPLFSFISVILSIFLKSKTFLTFGTLFLLIDIVKLSNNYFSQSLGWPLALIMAGLGMISVTYLAIRLKIRYL